jgi:exopolysaccharide biosynthesis polyprenyl glycosylphosphotransferase
MEPAQVFTQSTAKTAGLGERVRRRTGIGLTASERKSSLAIVDLCLLNGSLLVATMIWVDFDPSPIALIGVAKWFITLTLLWWLCSTVLDVYNLSRASMASSALTSAGLAALLTALIYVLIPVVTPQIVRRSYILGFVLFSTFSIVMWRFLYAKCFSQPAFQRRVVVVGTGSTVQVLLSELVAAHAAGSAHPLAGTGYQIIGLITERPEQASARMEGTPVLGDISKLVQVSRQHHIDEIAVALEEQCALDPHAYEVLLDCHELGWQLCSLPDLYERLTSRLPVEYAARDLATLPDHGNGAGARLYRFAKRAVDIVFALAGLPPLLLLMACVALGNALFSPGPLFYRQQRVGKGGRSYGVVKFRSMEVDAEKATGAVWCQAGDRRVTRVGQVLRRSRLDELPQIINVLKGEMSMVGPRPERPQFVGQLTQELPVYRARHAVLPGITGWAQIRYRYGSSVEDSRIKLEYDLYYVKHASLYLDLLILLRTVPTMLQFKGR